MFEEKVFPVYQSVPVLSFISVSMNTRLLKIKSSTYAYMNGAETERMVSLI